MEAWAWQLVRTERLEMKLNPPPPPSSWEATPRSRTIRAPGRPPELRVVRRGLRIAHDLTPIAAQAKLLHTLLHHELQAAELMAWALLRFASAPVDFRLGLLRLCQDELRHMNAYRELLEGLGFHVGSFPVRDWFWLRVPTCETPLQFVSLMGMGLEAANLEHAPRFGSRFAAVGADAAVRLQQRIAQEEEAHVRFAVHWYETWTDGQDFTRWRSELPPPLSPLLMRGKEVDREARRRAGMAETFIEALGAWTPEAEAPAVPAGPPSK